MVSMRNVIICCNGELLPPPQHGDVGDRSGARAQAPNPHEKMQKVEWEQRVPSRADVCNFTK